MQPCAIRHNKYGWKLSKCAQQQTKYHFSLLLSYYRLYTFAKHYFFGQAIFRHLWFILIAIQLLGTLHQQCAFRICLFSMRVQISFIQPLIFFQHVSCHTYSDKFIKKTLKKYNEKQ